MGSSGSSGSMSIGGVVGVAYNSSPGNSGVAVGVGNHVASINSSNGTIHIHIGFLN